MLYLVATPIGNLGDLSPRAVEVLSAVDVIYCEDTRHTGILLNHFNIKKPMRSLHTHNERERTEELVAALKDGRDVAYVSDAGMPGISDPGAMLVEACQKERLPHTVIPGASAAVIAAVLSGLPAQPFSFFGFLPRETKPRREMLDAIAALHHQLQGQGAQVHGILVERNGAETVFLLNADSFETLVGRKIANDLEPHFPA